MKSYWDLLPKDLKWLIYLKKIELEARDCYKKLLYQMKVLGTKFHIRNYPNSDTLYDAQRYVDGNFRYFYGKYYAKQESFTFFKTPVSRKEIIDYIMCQPCYQQSWSFCKDHMYMYQAFDFY